MRRVAESEEFQNAELDTGFIERHEHKLIPKTVAPSVAEIASAAMVRVFRPPVASIDPFDLLTNWKVNQAASEVVELEALGEVYRVKLTTIGDNHFNIDVNGESVQGRISQAENKFEVEVDGIKHKVSSFTNQNEFYLFTDEGPVHFNLPVPKYVAATSGAAGADDAVAPMTGTVTQVVVTPGTEVKQGDLLMTMVAMKMEHAIKAPKDGVIKSVLANEGEVRNFEKIFTIKFHANILDRRQESLVG